MSEQQILDPCSGSRMFYFDKEDQRVLFGDIRNEEHQLKDRSTKGGSRKLIIHPDQQMDFRNLPFSNGTFALVVFDPPHLVNAGRNSWLAKKYGRLGANYKDDLSAGFSECFRVLRPLGTLVFKWNEDQVKVSEILALTDQKPVFGNRCGRTSKSHWLVFLKPDEGEVLEIRNER